ncbi:unnamed protein product [Knipowitschia caucasica]
MIDCENENGAEEAEAQLKACMASRKARLGVCTRRINELKTLMVDGEDVDLNVFDRSYVAFRAAIDEFQRAHESVQKFLSEEEKEQEHTDWYEPRKTNMDYFIKEVISWKKQYLAQIKVEPQDSISNVSSKHSKHSTRSKASSIDAEKRKAKAETVALLAEAEALQLKHSLQIEETKLKTKLEQAELAAKIAASNAKVKYLEEESDGEKGNAMNEYYEEQREKRDNVLEISALSQSSKMDQFLQLGAVPKTPLQRSVFTNMDPIMNTPSNEQHDLNESEISTNKGNVYDKDKQRQGIGRERDNTNETVQRQSDITALIISQQKTVNVASQRNSNI